MSISYMPSRSSASTLRRTSQSQPPHSSTSSAALPSQDLPHPGPNPRPIIRLIAFGLILILGLLQLLPATHFRDPSDPHRNWVPFPPNSAKSGEFADLSNPDTGLDGWNNGEDGFLHIVSWLDCLDLRALAVLMNSTLSSSSYPDMVFFHFFIPGRNKDKVSFYKLKVLFPSSNLEIHGHEEIKETITTLELLGAKDGFEDLVPFVVPRVLQSLGKYVYISTKIIMKGKVEELIGFDLKTYAVAATEDCSKRLRTRVNPIVLDAIQRAASKPWVSESPYSIHACMPDLSVLLIDGRKLGADFVDSILWWRKVLNLETRVNQHPAVALALYDRYHKLPSRWLVKESTFPDVNGLVIHYDGPKTFCSSSSDATTSASAHGNMWTQYLPVLSDGIL